MVAWYDTVSIVTIIALFTKEDLVESILELVDYLINWFMAIPVLPWIIFTEEMVSSHLGSFPWHQHLLILLGVDICLAIIEYSAIWFLWKRLNIVHKIKTPRWLGRVAKDRPVSFLDLYFFGLTPQCHKFGVIAFFAKRHELGWRGFVALELGSFCRLLVYPLLGKYIFILVGVFVLLRFWEWQKDNGYVKRARNRFWP